MSKSRNMAMSRYKKWLKENPNHTKEMRRRQYYYLVSKKSSRCYERSYKNEKYWRWRGIIGLTWDYFQKILKKQKGKCAICKVEMTRPCADHDHKTGKFRGILCMTCNTAFAAFEKNRKAFNKYGIQRKL